MTSVAPAYFRCSKCNDGFGPFEGATEPGKPMCASCIDQMLGEDEHERAIQDCFDNEQETAYQAPLIAYIPCEDESLEWETVYNNYEDNVFKTCFCAYGGPVCGYYFQTCGGGPEGGYVMSLDKKSAWEVTRTWHQPFTITPLSTKLAVRMSLTGETEVAVTQDDMSHHMSEQRWHNSRALTHREPEEEEEEQSRKFVEPAKPVYPASYHGPKKRSTQCWRVWSLYHPEEALAFNEAMNTYYKERKEQWNRFVGKLENNLVGLKTSDEA